MSRRDLKDQKRMKAMLNAEKNRQTRKRVEEENAKAANIVRSPKFESNEDRHSIYRYCDPYEFTSDPYESDHEDYRMYNDCD